MGKVLRGGSGWVLLTWSLHDGKLVNQWAMHDAADRAGADEQGRPGGRGHGRDQGGRTGADQVVVIQSKHISESYENRRVLDIW
jgi:hypothetical protein